MEIDIILENSTIVLVYSLSFSYEIESNIFYCCLFNHNRSYIYVFVNVNLNIYDPTLSLSH